MKKLVMHSIWLVLVLSVLSSSVCAGTLGPLTYLIADGEVAITECDRWIEASVVIPNEIEGLPVVEISDYAFSGRAGLESLTIPDTVRNIGRSAFDGCDGMTLKKLPNSLISIGAEAFRNCEGLTSVIIPNGVTKIPDQLFQGCRNLKSIIIPNTVTEIGFSAFSLCALSSVIIPESVISIGNYIFDRDGPLKSITIPSAFHSQSEAIRLNLQKLWPDGFFLPSNSGNASQALANAILVNGFVVDVEITYPGAGYVEVPAITITGGGGSGAEALAVLTEGRVTSVEIISTGRGYTSAPTVSIDPPPVTSSQLSLRMVPAITVTGITGQTETIEVADNADGPWSEWRTVVIGEEGTT